MSYRLPYSFTSRDVRDIRKKRDKNIRTYSKLKLSLENRGNNQTNNNTNKNESE
jgi:hypothetical protein